MSKRWYTLATLGLVIAAFLIAGCTAPTPPTTPTPTTPPTTTIPITSPPTTAPTTQPTTVPTTAPPSMSVEIGLIAKNIAYNTSTITVPACSEVTIHFDNQDSNTPHNFAVYQSSAAQQQIFKGEVITGPKTIDYTFMAPCTAGTYFFRCDIHPFAMTGDFVVQ